ncbi:DUF4935 domain-containing protein [Candidatus Pacearchaeota archaeon]|nr:DUF4935 domain-containing protein [Candidatus Pacearchaeota archaeon]
MKYHIFFDTSILRNSGYDEGDPFDSPAIANINQFLGKNISVKGIIKMFIPEVVFDECIYQKITPVYSKFKDARSEINKIAKRFGIKMLSKLAFGKIENFDFYNYFKNKYIPTLKKNGLSLIPVPEKIDIQEVLERALLKIPPFDAGRGDNGLKDSLIWLSIKDFVEKNSCDRIIFIVNDEHFNARTLKEEIKNVSQAEFNIFKNSDEALVFISESLKVDEQRKKRIEDVKVIIRNNTNILLDELKKNKYYYYGNPLVSYNLVNINFSDIIERENIYSIYGEIQLQATTSDLLNGCFFYVSFYIKYNKLSNTILEIKLTPKNPLREPTLFERYSSLENPPKYLSYQTFFPKNAMEFKPWHQKYAENLKPQDLSNMESYSNVVTNTNPYKDIKKIYKSNS